MINRSQKKLISDAYRAMSADVKKIAEAIDKNVAAWEGLPLNANNEQILKVAKYEHEIIEALNSFVKNTQTQRDNVLFLLSGVRRVN